MSKKTNTTRTASIELAGDAAQLVAALERLQAGGFAVESLVVGKVSVTLRAAAGERNRDDDRPAPTGIYHEMGGDLLTRVAAEVLPGVDLQPAIGRAG